MPRKPVCVVFRMDFPPRVSIIKNHFSTTFCCVFSMNGRPSMGLAGIFEEAKLCRQVGLPHLGQLEVFPACASAVCIPCIVKECITESNSQAFGFCVWECPGGSPLLPACSTPRECGSDVDYRCAARKQGIKFTPRSLEHFNHLMKRR